jgi:hypothetical protein
MRFASPRNHPYSYGVHDHLITTLYTHRDHKHRLYTQCGVVSDFDALATTAKTAAQISPLGDEANSRSRAS